MFNLHADVDARTMTPSRNTRSYTLRSVPSSPGRSFLYQQGLKLADITSAVTVLKITHFTDGRSRGDVWGWIDLQAIRGWQLIIAKYSH